MVLERPCITERKGETMAREKLYNGIELPEEWPPRGMSFDDRTPPPEPPYLAKDAVKGPLPVDVGRQLFVDDFLVESMDGLRREYPHPVKYAGNPVLKPETWLELNGSRNSTARPNGGGLWWDPAIGRFRLWYEAGWLNCVAYAESSDGIHFERVNIADGTNQIYPPDFRPDSWEVVPDFQRDNPYSRWLMYVHGPGGDERGLCFASDNGRYFFDRKLSGRAGDRSNFFWNPFRRKWVFSLRVWGRNVARAACYYETDDFFSGSDWPWDGERAIGGVVPWAKADDLDGIDPEFKCPAQLYALQAVAYESIMVGAFEIHRGPDNLSASRTGNPKITDIVFAYSRDGFHWTRPDRTPAIASERWGSGKWDTGYVQPLGNLFTISDEKLCFYYGAFAGDTTRLSTIGSNVPENGMYHNGAMGLAHLRRDGFCAITGDGTLETRVLEFTSGDRLYVNADCSQGSIEVEIEGGDRAKLENVDSTKICVCAAKPGVTKLRFKLSGGARLYSFWFSDSKGASRGYLGGGGRDYPGTKDL